MANPPTKHRISAMLGRLVVRLYALAILAVMVWAGYAAVAYMVRTVFFPVRVPPRFMAVATQPSVQEIEEGRVRAAALQTERPAPGHFHLVPQWFQPDAHNSCTTSGCHSVVPHSQKKETRAFANFHTTFLNCQMCHDARSKGTVAATWVNTASGEPQDAPALLQLLKVFEVDRDKIESSPGEVHATIVSLLRQSLAAIGEAPVLNYLLIQIDTSEPGSPVWRQAVSQLGSELPNHLRGEYGAKIYEQIAGTSLDDEREHLADLARQYQEAPPGPSRTNLQKQIHEHVLPKPEACLTCHGGEPPRLNFESLGYPPQRVAALRSNAIANMIQKLREGGQFHLPAMLEGGNAP